LSVLVRVAPSGSLKVKVSLTAVVSELNSTDRSVVIENPGTPTRAKPLVPSVGAAVIEPATPSGVTSTRPSTPVSRTPASSAVPSPTPRKRSTLVKPILTTFVPALVVICSNEKTPLSVWPKISASTRLVGVPAWTRRYGPAATFSSTSSSSPSLNVLSTAAFVVLISRSTGAVSEKSSDRLAGIRSVAERLAAIPAVFAGCVCVAAAAGWIRIAPVISSTITNAVVPLPSSSVASLTAIPITFVVASRSNVNEPVIRWPKTSTWTPRPVTLREVLAMPSCSAAVVLSWTSKVPPTTMPGMSTVTVAAIAP
jgi:hypothetical protein